MLFFIILPSLYFGFLTYLLMSTTEISNKDYRLFNICYRVTLIIVRFMIVICAHYVYTENWCWLDNSCNILTEFIDNIVSYFANIHDLYQGNYMNRYLIFRLLCVYAMIENSNIFILQLKNYKIRNIRIVNSVVKLVIYLAVVYNPTRIMTTFIAITFLTETIKDIFILLKTKLDFVSSFSYAMTVSTHVVIFGMIVVNSLECAYDLIPFLLSLFNMIFHMTKN